MPGEESRGEEMALREVVELCGFRGGDVGGTGDCEDCVSRLSEISMRTGVGDLGGR